MGRRHDVEGFVAKGLAPHAATADEIARVRDRALYVLQEREPSGAAAA